MEIVWLWFYSSVTSNCMPIIKAKLLESRPDFGGYQVYVFENLDSIKWHERYVMTVRYPNWQTANLRKGDIGFLNFKVVHAGDKWWDKNANQFNYYKQSNIVFQDFVRDAPPVDLTITCD